jgi:hypothetical protein
VDDREANAGNSTCKLFFVVQRMDELSFNVVSRKALNVMSEFNSFEGVFISERNGPVIDVVFIVLVIRVFFVLFLKRKEKICNEILYLLKRFCPYHE